MKKLLLALATISTLSLASCETADISPMNSSGTKVVVPAIENIETEGIELEKPKLDKFEGFEETQETHVDFHQK